MILSEHVSFQILDVLRFHRNKISYETKPRDFFVLSYRINGCSVFHHGKKHIKVTPNECLMISPNTPYTQDSEDEEIICVHLAAKGVEENLIRSIPAFSALEAMLCELYSVWQSKKSGYLFRAKSILYDILYRLDGAKNAKMHKTDALIAPGVAYIQAHFAEQDFSLSHAISLSHISAAYFRRRFFKLYEMSPLRFVNECRINRAKELLKSGLAASEIARKIGFTNEKYFYAVFRKYVGLTPSEWKCIR